MLIVPVSWCLSSWRSGLKKQSAINNFSKNCSTLCHIFVLLCKKDAFLFLSDKWNKLLLEFSAVLGSKCTSNSLWWLKISVGGMPKNSSFLLKVHSAHWDTFVWMWSVGLLFYLHKICSDSCYFKPHTPTQLWLLGICLWLEYIRSNWVGMPSFVDN